MARSKKSKKRSPKKSIKRSKKRSTKKRSTKKRSPKRTSTRGCKPGYVRRKSYTRKSYSRKSGSRVKSVKVKSHCIKSQGKNGLRVIPKLRKGELKQFGYSSSNSVASRHRALAKAIREYSDLSVFRKLNVLYIFNKNKNPSLASKFNSDKAWIKKTYMTE